MEKKSWKKVNMNRAKVIAVFWLALLTALSLTARAEDPDYGNDCNSAELIGSFGTALEGTLSPAGDEDWFSFTAATYGLYEISIQSQSGYKYLEVYGPDGCESPQRIANYHTSTGTRSEDIFISWAGTYYVRVYNGSGLYQVMVDEVDVYAEDRYGDTCAEANELVVDGEPGSDGITDWGTDEDWLVFDTDVLHQYEVTLTRSFTSNIVFDLYSGDCVTNLSANRTLWTFYSWYGGGYNLRVHSSNFTKEGHYQISVTDLGERADDHGNTCEAATSIDTNGAEVVGDLQYGGANAGNDEDWFSFTAETYGLYEINLQSQSGYKYLELYGPDGCDSSRRIANFYSPTGSKSEEIFVSLGGTYYVRIYNGSGLYRVSVNELGVYATDSYADTCAEANELVVDGGPAYDGITDWGTDEDWLTFGTLLLHKYEITLERSLNANVVFDLYGQDCETNIKANRTSLTLVSWDEANRNLKVHSQNFGKEGYYDIWVDDLGEQLDDHGNGIYESTWIGTNGQKTDGALQYTADIGSDEDWFAFIASVEGLYEISLWSQSGYKYLVVYRFNEESEQLEQITSFYTATETTKDISLTEGIHLLKVHNGSGLYKVGVLSPDPQCGDPDHPYPSGDLNHDCVVNFIDVAVLAESWLVDNRP